MEVSQMGEVSSMIGFIVIVTLYIVIGLMSGAGSAFITQRIFAPKAEQIFYGLFLIPIAGFYLAFTAYFRMEAAWRLESAAVLAFAATGLLGTLPLR
jgi:phosphate/sulfate permease